MLQRALVADIEHSLAFAIGTVKLWPLRGRPCASPQLTGIQCTEAAVRPALSADNFGVTHGIVMPTVRLSTWLWETVYWTLNIWQSKYSHGTVMPTVRLST